MYSFTFQYDIASDRDSLSWSETLDASQVLIESLSVIIRLPSGYHPTEIEPSSAVTREEDSRTLVSWTGNTVAVLRSVRVERDYCCLLVKSFWPFQVEVESLKLALFGWYWWDFWMIHLGIGTVVPIILLFAFPRNPSRVGLASLMVAVAFLSTRPQLYQER